MSKNMFAFIIHTRWVGRFHWGNPHIAQKQVWLTSNMMRPQSSQCNFLSQRPLNNASNLVPVNWIKVDCLATTISPPALTSKRSSSATSDICVAIWLRTLEFLWVQLVQLLSNSNFPFIMIMRRAMFSVYLSTLSRDTERRLFERLSSSMHGSLFSNTIFLRERHDKSGLRE